MAKSKLILAGRTHGNRIIVQVLKNCARCQGTHRNLVFQPFTDPCGEDTHWRLCPKLKEPILLRSVEAPDPGSN